MQWGKQAGKSTFIDLFAGLIFPTKGKIILNNKFEQSQSVLKEWQKNISIYLNQYIYLKDLSRKHSLWNNKKDIDIEKVKKICKLVLLDEFIDINDESFFTNTFGNTGEKLSGGQKQRLALARALYKDSQVLILDELQVLLILKLNKSL